ncbi:MAG: hypothetical protein CVU61_00700 [Deltaproteobacteria bacterium HGW-Deltaproteobacteria-19]|nr:MAG: hypothetical protein CVU61_00700 [Deltaproteobacteria bacterium HGW-Deltaproteobacteria-19]
MVFGQQEKWFTMSIDRGDAIFMIAFSVISNYKCIDIYAKFDISTSYIRSGRSSFSIYVFITSGT